MFSSAGGNRLAIVSLRDSEDSSPSMFPLTIFLGDWLCNLTQLLLFICAHKP
ncbi:hypothetical protein THIOM_002930 [Candidatus Thiomargarita nelsonii]|uniref:Uncharacterized protein n=1 Tax=Candidatus Thiomargarita nelsonii TaxID=1003181 RepID=A0A176S049_9GAMM|nr:hypothetical protein THIOM_002930 [Candidatus Thiomargarita nelsonii]